MLNAKPAYKVLIAEDELLVRVGLNITVPWADYNMEVIGLCEDGPSAWQLYQQFLPDLVLTDIRMPGLDGIELVRLIRQENPECEIIVITCLEDFDILYELMQMRITGYLLKATMTRADMEKLIMKAWQNLQNLPAGPDGPDRLDSDGSSSGQKPAETSANQLNSQQPANWQPADKSPGPARLCLALKFIGQQGSLLKSAVIEIFQRRLLPAQTGRVLTIDQLVLFVFFDFEQAQSESLRQNVEELTLYVKDIFSVQLRLAALMIDEQLDKLDWLAQTAASVLDNKYFYPDAYYVLDLTLTRQALNPQLELRLLYLQEKIMARLPALIYQQKKDLLKSCFSQLKAALSQNKEQFDAALFDLFCVFGEAENHWFEQLERQDKAGDALAEFEKAIFAAEMDLHPVYGKSIYKTLLYIKDNAVTDLSLSKLAEQVNLSNNYYAALFKQALSVNFSEYLGAVRLDLACQIMLETSVPLNEVAVLSGFSDTSYFSRFFKQKTGVTPHQWRINQ